MTKITTIDYDTITQYDNFLKKCTNKEDNTDIIIPTLLLTVPCGPSSLRLISLMVYTLKKLLKTNQW